ncbi:MAG TPA: hypothetical protein VNA25_04245, partial [Phycisphaerae bacterium]|nr:hypothetical protein [Phycisphaerae bacterium]
MSQVEERILELWNKRKLAAEELRQVTEDRWYRNWRAYRNTVKPRRFRGLQWQYSEPIPDIFRVVETLTAHHTQLLFRNPHWLGIEAPMADEANYVQMCKALLMGGWRRAEGYKKTNKAARSGLIFGHTVGKLYWQTVLGERQITEFGNEIGPDGELLEVQRRVTVPDIRFDGPQIESVNLFNIFQDPTGNEEWFIQRIPSSLSKLKQLNKDYGGVLYKNLNQLTAEKALSRGAYGGIGKQVTTESFNELAQAVDGIPDTSQLADDHVELWQCWGYVPKEVRTYPDDVDENGQTLKATQWRLQIIASESVVIRDEPAPTFDHRPPFFNTPYIELPDQLYGDTPISYVHKLSEMRSQIESNRLNGVMMEMFGTSVVHMDAEVDGRAFKEPGGYLKVRPPFGLGLNDSFSSIPRNPIFPEAYAESANKERQILDTSGATEPFQGTFAAGGSHRTKGEFDGTVALGSARINQARMWWDEAWLKPIVSRMFKYYQTRLTTPQILQLIGDNGQKQQIPVDFRQLQYDIDVWVDTGLYGSMD